MFEYHGWVTVRSSTGATPGDHQRLELADRIGARAAGVRRAEHDLLDIRWVNGRQLITVAGCRNRRSTSAQDVLDFFGWIGTVAPGSYGLLHVWDDEDPRGEEYDNGFRTMVLARGTVTERADADLSPCVPTIEDAADLHDMD